MGSYPDEHADMLAEELARLHNVARNYRRQCGDEAVSVGLQGVMT